jgi:hypothetical protein
MVLMLGALMIRGRCRLVRHPHMPTTPSQLHHTIPPTPLLVAHDFASITRDPSATMTIETIDPPPSLFRWVLGFLLVGACWGLTTPFMRRAAM